MQQATLALPLSAAFGLLGAAHTFAEARPEAPPASFEVQLRGVDDAPLTGSVAARCWRDQGPPIELSGPTDASGRFHVEAAGCLAIELAAVSPGHLPTQHRQGPPEGEVTLSLLVEAPVSTVEIRDVGWAGRDAPGARLVVERSPEGSLRVVGWDLLNDQPASERADADLWLEAGDAKTLAQWRPVVGTPVEPSTSALPGRPWLGPTPRGLDAPVLWHAWALDQVWSGERHEKSSSVGQSGYWLSARDGQTTALLLPDGPPTPGVYCLDGAPGCETWTWTFAALVDPSGAGRFAHGLQPRVEALLSVPNPAGQPRRTPIAQLVQPGSQP